MLFLKLPKFKKSYEFLSNLTNWSLFNTLLEDYLLIANLDKPNCPTRKINSEANSLNPIFLKSSLESPASKKI